jgi:hypothetical protein
MQPGPGTAWLPSLMPGPCWPLSASLALGMKLVPFQAELEMERRTSMPPAGAGRTSFAPPETQGPKAAQAARSSLSRKRCQEPFPGG